jgi:hypothetical protein
MALQGKARLTAVAGDKLPVLASGSLINLWLCNLFGVYLGFDSDTTELRSVVADTDVTAFTW